MKWKYKIGKDGNTSAIKKLYSFGSQTTLVSIHFKENYKY